MCNLIRKTLKKKQAKSLKHDKWKSKQANRTVTTQNVNALKYSNSINLKKKKRLVPIYLACFEDFIRTWTVA